MSWKPAESTWKRWDTSTERRPIPICGWAGLFSSCRTQGKVDAHRILREVNSGYVIEEIVPEENSARIRGESYKLEQLHFHTPSEYLVDGKTYPMEVHLVHQNDRGGYIVLGLLFEEGEKSEVMDRLPSFRAARGEDSYADPIDYHDLLGFDDNRPIQPHDSRIILG